MIGYVTIGTNDFERALQFAAERSQIRAASAVRPAKKRGLNQATDCSRVSPTSRESYPPKFAPRIAGALELNTRSRYREASRQMPMWWNWQTRCLEFRREGDSPGRSAENQNRVGRGIQGAAERSQIRAASAVRPAKKRGLNQATDCSRVSPTSRESYPPKFAPRIAGALELNTRSRYREASRQMPMWWNWQTRCLEGAVGENP